MDKSKRILKREVAKSRVRKIKVENQQSKKEDN
jgi:hypothetical protein